MPNTPNDKIPTPQDSDSELRNSIKETIVGITVDHNSDTLEEVLDVYVDKFIALFAPQREAAVRAAERQTMIRELGWANRNGLEGVRKRLAQLKEPSNRKEDNSND